LCDLSGFPESAALGFQEAMKTEIINCDFVASLLSNSESELALEEAEKMDL